MAGQDPKEFVSDRTLAGEGIAARKTLQNWRSAGVGPPYFKLGSRVFYRRSDVEAWIEAQRVATKDAA